MEFIERLPIKELHFLAHMSFKDYKPYDKSSSKNDDERRKNYDKMINTCNSFIKANGEIKRLYKFTGNHNWGNDGTGSGRLFAGGNGIQGLPKKIRGFLLRNSTTDIDMVNCHPVILKYLCVKHQINHEELEFYIDNRDEILERFADRDTAKTMFLKAVNDDNINKKEKDEGFKRFDKQCKEIQKILTKLTCYKDIVADVPSNKLYNWYGSAINRILCYYENCILQIVIKTLNEKALEICAPMFDGCMVYDNYYEDTELLQDIQDAVADVYPELNMRFSYKEHNIEIQMPDDYAIPSQVNEDDINSFTKVATNFELKHSKIINKGIFVKEVDDDVVVMSEQHIKTSYKHLVYDKIDKNGELATDNFINTWLTNNPSQRCYDDIGVFPDGLECPKIIFNMWRKFKMENVDKYEYKQLQLSVVLNHIKILCGNDSDVYEYFVKWIAQMIQYPAVKSICPTLISSQGAGKGTLLKLLGAMLGENKVFETTSPSRDVWGDFNGKMCNTFLINLNELSKKETVECEGKIKGLITDPNLTINNKGVNQYVIKSFHRFIITTNNNEPINTSKDDRRNLIIRSSDEKCGNKAYFEYLHTILEDENVIKTCYEYFKSIEGIDEFNKIPIPVTNHQSSLKELAISPVEMWLEAFTRENYNEISVELLGSKACELFKNWCKKMNIEYSIDAKKLGVRLSLLNISGIEKGRHTNKGDTKIYNIEKLKKHFKLGCLIQIDDNVIDESDI